MRLHKEYIKKYETVFREILDHASHGTFDEAALPSYTHSNRLMSWIFWKRVETALQIAACPAGCSVLDFGAGGGVTFQYLHDKGCRITACENDFYHLTCETAKRFGIEIAAVNNLFEVNGVQFDRIFALDVFEHIDNPCPYVDKLNELCKHEGSIIISGPTENLLYKLGRRMAGFSGHYHVHDIFQIEDAFRRSGLKKVRLSRLLPVLTLFRISVWVKS